MTVRTMHHKEADLRAALTALAARWQEMSARQSAKLPDDLITDPYSVDQERALALSHTYSKAAADLLNVLRTGRIPHDLMTDAELEQHGTPEEARR